jgi:hypothetical protein
MLFVWLARIAETLLAVAFRVPSCAETPST